jgi:hypothetical protein
VAVQISCQFRSLQIGIIALAALSAFLGPAIAFEYSGFRMGMNETEISGVARRNGYKLTQIPNGYLWAVGGRGGTVSLCNSRLFAAASTFDANLQTFIGLVRERQNQYGEPEWTTTQSYSNEGQQFSSLEAKWDDPVGRFQPSVSLILYGAAATIPRVSISYSAQKYICGR